ncbi:MAG: ASPIC/UnbV domain-containing protein [Planctomycetaceae bacterium]
MGRRGNRDAVGSVLTLQHGGGPQVFAFTGGGSYASAMELRWFPGIPESIKKEIKVQVTWPGGRVSEHLCTRPHEAWVIHEPGE